MHKSSPSWPTIEEINATKTAKPKTKTPIAMIVGLVAGAVLVVALIAGVVLFIRRSRMNDSKIGDNPNNNAKVTGFLQSKS
ncbi:11108_t:CDS:2 [Entrophospora sp. SA101]|nr:11108_t:CDS:2 [Entrophospora sp. SA101]